jgi:heat shock protein HslJ
MKKIIFSFVIIVILLAGCKSAPESKPEPAPAPARTLQDFSDIKGREWNLTEIHVGGKDIEFNRNTLEKEGFRDIFTLKMDDQTISGKGAPNNYSAPYTLGEGQKISVNVVRATLMAPLREPEKLREHDFFTFIQNIYEWNIAGSNLELKSKTADGEDVVLILN